jgi:hypothetical protein
MTYSPSGAGPVLDDSLAPKARYSFRVGNTAGLPVGSALARNPQNIHKIERRREPMAIPAQAVHISLD